MCVCVDPNHQLVQVACCWPRSGCPKDCQTPEEQEALAEGEESPVAYKHKPFGGYTYNKKQDKERESRIEQETKDSLISNNFRI